jgi:hypothetical protein
VAAKLAVAVVGALLLIAALIGAGLQAAVTAVFGAVDHAGRLRRTDRGHPARLLRALRRRDSVCPGLDWSILAAIGKIEIRHGRLDAPGVHNGENFAGAGVISGSVSL